MAYNTYNKLKSFHLPWLLILVYLTFPVILRPLLGIKTSLISDYLRFAVMAFLCLLFLGAFIKTKNFLFGLIIVSLIVFVIVLVLIQIQIQNSISGIYSLILLLTIFLLFVPFVLMGLKFPKNGGLWIRYFRSLLILAATPLQETKNGFTNRSYPAGAHDFDIDMILSFSKFLNHNLIATTHINSSLIVLVFSNGFFQYIPFKKPNLKNETYVSFDYQGSYNVHISEKDYRKFKHELTFDQLCKSFGNVILDLLVLFKKGEKKLIIKILRDANCNQLNQVNEKG